MKRPHGPLPIAQRPVVLFDGACPLCSREIAHYRRRRGAEQIAWLDVSNPGVDPGELGVTREQALARFHVRDPQGQWHTGAAGFVLLWSNLPSYSWLARLVRILRLTPILEIAYKRFLAWRNSRDCDQGKCGMDSNP